MEYIKKDLGRNKQIVQVKNAMTITYFFQIQHIIIKNSDQYLSWFSFTIIFMCGFTFFK